MITIIGLGVEKGDLTERGKREILRAVEERRKIVVRTAKTASYQTVAEMQIPHVVLDDVYEKSRSFTTLTKNLAKAVVENGADSVYLIDGSIGEDNSAKALIKRFRGKVNVIDGISKASVLSRVAGFQSCSYTAVSAYELAEKANSGNLGLPLIVYDLDDGGLANDVKLLLGELYGEETLVLYLQGGKAKKIPLFALDRQKNYDYTSAVAIDEQALLQKERFTMEDLKEIVVRLRKPDGCPWDRVQTPQSIKMSAVEEAYELVDAIDCDDDEKILEEAGDILLQTVFHAVMKEETGAFTLTDVLTGICKKLITRHTHVFGEDKAKDENGALGVWEANKRKEKGQDTFAKSVNDVPKCFPAVMRAQKVGKRASKAGMDFKDVESAKARLIEELTEFTEAYATGDIDATEKELGDVLFSAVNVGRKAGCDCEKALKESVDRFAERFTKAEAFALADGKTVEDLSPDEWDQYYNTAKNR
ncbi:MAG: nucleoside triphosphate pyrophosphohydrolase [Clostridia bacterium]|nr:nucleoside triphosphate pyrophosphohydrolase [Clostridia bacterium]